MAKKERLYYLDFIRALSTFIIVLTHYNSLYFFFEVKNERAIILGVHPFGIYIGAFGVSLFLILSGAALYLTYGNAEKFDFKKFYAHRFRRIYPTFWIAYIFAFLLNFLSSKGASLNGIPRRNIIYSVLGLDSYLANFGVKVFYNIGIWFLGFIILFYLVCPVFLLAVKHKPIIAGAVCLVLYAGSFLFLGKCDISTLVTTRLPELMFGMFFIKYFKEGNVRWYVALAALAVLLSNQFFDFSFIQESIRVTYIGISAFLFLTYISRFFKFALAQNICSVICKYSYPCFILHFNVILKVVGGFDLAAIGRLNSLILFVACLVAIAVASWLLYNAEKIIMAALFKKRDDVAENQSIAEKQPAAETASK